MLALAAFAFVAFVPARALAQPAPSADAKKKATDLFKEAKAAFDKGDFAKALAGFKDSYAAVASPNSHLYIARCMAQLGDNVGAYTEFEKTIAEASARPEYSKTGDSAKSEMAEQASKITILTLNIAHADETTVVHVGGAEYPRDKWAKPTPMKSGQVEILVESKSKPPVKMGVTLNAGDKPAIDFDVLAPPPSAIPSTPGVVTPPPAQPTDTKSGGASKKTLRTAAFIAGGVGVVGLGMFVIQGIRSNSTYSDLELHCGAGPCKANRQTEVDRGKVQQTMANIGLIVGITGVAAGTTLFILSRGGKTETGKAAPKVEVGIGPTSVVASGSF